ncbi:MAG: HEAT repeat domain-containing protein [Terricaulis sp.]
MTDETVTAFKRDGQKFTLELLGGLTATLVLIALAIVEWRAPSLLTTSQALIVFGVVCTISVLGSWRQAIVDGRLPAPFSKTKITHNHITGWGFILIAASVSVIIGLASWAGPHEQDIGATMSLYVVIGLALVFIGAAIAPPFNVGEAKGALHRIVNLLHPFGSLLSAIDSVMVFAVAGSAGVTQRWLGVRYFVLLGTMGSCTALGYFITSPPLALIPLAWAFVIAISISRRWGWVEEDRDLYMLNRSVGAHLRVGFGEDLRDESLLSFVFMFLLIPLALRQAQEWSGGTLFDVSHLGHKPALVDWISFFGGELAKAAPFVDWAEVYGVKGDEQFLANTVASKHVIFAMRVLLDLVFMAALVQALSIAARNAKQMELFQSGTLDRLDPFTEPREFRKLLRRGSNAKWEINPDALAKFPKYDAVRLAELSDKEFTPIDIAAIALRRRDGSDEAAKFTDQLLSRTYAKDKDVDAIEEVLNAIHVSKALVTPEDLDRARIQLNGRQRFNRSRIIIMQLVAIAPRTDDKFDAIRSALTGVSANDEGTTPEAIRDAIRDVRLVAVRALREQVRIGEARAIRLLEEVAKSDPAEGVRSEAQKILGLEDTDGAPESVPI